MNESRETVLEARHERYVHGEPHEPSDPAGEPHPVCAHDRAAPVHGGHAPEVPVLPSCWLGAILHALPDDVSSMEPRLESDLGYTGEVVEVHHVTDYEHLRVAG